MVLPGVPSPRQTAEPSASSSSDIHVLMSRALGSLAEHVHLELEIRRLRGRCQGDIERDYTLRHQVGQVLVERLHTVLLASVGDEIADLANALLKNKVADGRRDDHDLTG